MVQIIQYNYNNTFLGTIIKRQKVTTVDIIHMQVSIMIMIMCIHWSIPTHLMMADKPKKQANMDDKQVHWCLVWCQLRITVSNFYVIEHVFDYQPTRYQLSAYNYVHTWSISGPFNAQPSINFRILWIHPKMQNFLQYVLRIQTLITLASLDLILAITVTYHMAGNFRGVLIFVIFVVDSAVTKISTHEN